MPLSSHTFALQLAASPQVHGPGPHATVLAPRDAALLAWLALEGPTPRTRLAPLLWPDSEPAAARNTLRQRLFQLRRQFGEALVVGEATLALADGVTHDLHDADEVLADTAQEIGGEFATWLAQQRGRRRERMHDSLVELCEMAEQAHDHADALLHARELLALEPLSEEAHRRVMRLLYLMGDRTAALLAFDRCEQLLKDEVGARPSVETLALLASIEGAVRQPVPTIRSLPAAVLRPPRLIGRAAELHAAAAAWQCGQAVSISGEAGLGKSRLIDELAALFAGTVVVQARPGDAVVPYGSIGRLLRAVVERAPAIVAQPLRPELARLLPEHAAPSPAVLAQPAAPELQRVALQRAVMVFLQQAAAHGVEGLVLDDLHFADDASLDLLLALAVAVLRPDAPLRLRIGFAQRPAEGGAGIAALHDALLEEQRLAPVVVRPLNEAQLLELVESLQLDAVNAPALARQLHQHSGGNLLFALETLRQAWVEAPASGLGSGLLPRPVSVARLIERRLAKLSPAALRLARCAAVAGQDFSIELAALVLRVPALDLADAWTELVQAHVLSENTFAHDLIFEATLVSVPPPIARHLHGEIATLLAARASEPGRLALHWAAAHRWAQAGAAYRAAAARACDAARMLEQAALLGDAARCFAHARDAGARFDALLARARVLAEHESACEAQASVAELTAAASNDEQKLHALDVQLLLGVARSDVDAALRIGPEAIAAARALGRTDLEFRFAISLSGALRAARRANEAVTLLQAYEAHARSVTDPDVQSDYWAGLGIALDYADRLRDALPAWQAAEDVGRRASRTDLLWLALSNGAATRAKMGQVRCAVDILQQANQLALATTEATTLRATQMRCGFAHRLRDVGRYAEALALLSAALESFRASASAADNIASTEHRLAVLFQQLGQPARGQALLAAEHAALPIGLAVMRRVHRADLARQLGGDALGNIRAALEMVPDPQDIYHRMASLFATTIVDPEEGEALAAGVAAWATRRERLGLALAGHTRAAACALALGRAARALPHVETALHLAAEYQPDTYYLPELWLVAAQVFEALARHDDARRAARDGHAWVMAVHDAHVAPEFRESFLHRNPVNRELLGLAARWNV